MSEEQMSLSTQQPHLSLSARGTYCRPLWLSCSRTTTPSFCVRLRELHHARCAQNGELFQPSRQGVFQFGQHVESLGPTAQVILIKASLDEQHVVDIDQITRSACD